jgi:hypothetical protein
MPIIINELVIQTNLVDSDKSQLDSYNIKFDEQKIEDIISECVEQVLRIIKEEKEK